MHARQKKAFMWGAAALVLGSILLMTRVWLDQNGAVERPELGVVGEFILRDHLGEPLTRDQMRRSLTTIIYWPEGCLRQESCVDARANAESVKAWVEQSLTAKWGEDHNPLLKIVVGPGAEGLFSEAGWRRFIVNPSEATLLPAGTDLSRPWLVVVDNSLQFAARQDLEQSVDLRSLERVLSKTAFDQYLGNYLSKRTFMGPKRTQN